MAAGLLLTSIPSFCVAETQVTVAPYAQELIEKALQKNLHNDRYWNVLLHYKFGFTGFRSLIDDDNFFIAKNGKRNPKAELVATINSFFLDDSHLLLNEPYKCRFIGRYNWLKKELNIDASKLPKYRCDLYEKKMEILKPKAVGLIFPSAYMGNPASMFGHTLLRIDREYESKLISYAVNYAAMTAETNGVIFAVKGLFGMYDGYFSMLPYYEKVKEYSDINRRDMWEMDLNFTEEEVEKLIYHLWEMQGIASDYYFFDENCSYNLLFLLEAGRPEMNLTDGVNFWTIPVDTVRGVIEEGVLGEVKYRPSRAEKVLHMSKELSEEELKYVFQISDNKFPAKELLKNENISNDNKIKIIEIATEIIQSKYSDEDITKKEYKKLFIQTLSARGKLKSVSNKEEHYNVEAPVRPDFGHYSSRFSIGAGFKVDLGYTEYSLRPAYHDLYDSDFGYLPFSEIEFMDIKLRNYHNRGSNRENDFILEKIEVINIVSMPVSDRLFRSWGWFVRTGLERAYAKEKENALLGYLDFGRGKAYGTKDFRVFGYFSVDARVGNDLYDDYSLGLGLWAGAGYNFKDNSKIFFEVNSKRYGLGENKSTSFATIGLTSAFSQKSSLTFKISRNVLHVHDESIYSTDVMSILNFYF